MDWIQGLVPLLVPAVIAAAKGMFPKIPKWLLPILAPVLGAVADILAYYAGLQWTPFIGAVLGAAGVASREIYDQLKKAVAGG